jgi:hypothetical protein
VFDRPKATRFRRADGITLDRCSAVVPPVPVCCPPVVLKETDARPLRVRQAQRSRSCWNGEQGFCREAGQHEIARVMFRRRRMSHDDDPGRRPGISLKDRTARTLERSQNMRTMWNWQFPEPTGVLAWYDEQTIEIRPTDYDGIQVDVHGNVAVLTTSPVTGHRLRNCATAAFRFDGEFLADEPPRAVAFVHVLPLDQ